MRNKEIGKVEVALQSVEVQVLSLETASPSSSDEAFFRQNWQN